MKKHLIDLHVHTPSSKDYKGPKTHREYYEIIKNAYDNKVDVICITDHSSVEGYKEIMNLRNNTQNLLRDLKKRELDESISLVIKNVEEEFNILNSVHILMGVELSVSPGIHYIIVFAEYIKPEEVEGFLTSLAPDIANNFGNEEYHLQINTIQLFKKAKEVFGDSCIIYAPHCDSSSGLTEALKDLGTERKIILTCDDLTCVSFNKDNTRNYIKENLLKSFKTTRNKPLCYIQDSDYHGRVGEKVGAFAFALNTDKKISFKEILKEFESGHEIETTIDTLQQNYENSIEKEVTFYFDLIKNTMDNDRLIEIVCATLNSHKGQIALKIQLDNPYSYLDDIEEISNNLSEIITSKLKYKKANLRYTNNYFPLSTSSQVLLIKFLAPNRLFLYNNICYFIDKNNEVVPASANEIESIVSKKIHLKYGKSNDRLLKSMGNNVSNMQGCFSCYSVVYRIDDKLEHVKDLIVDTNDVQPIPEVIRESKDYPNGLADGNIACISAIGMRDYGRLVDSYLRFTLPIFTYDLDSSTDDNALENSILNDNSIVIYPGGGVHIALNNIKLFSDLPCLIVKLSDKHCFSPLVFTAYLKSSFCQWYLMKILNYQNVCVWQVETT